MNGKRRTTVWSLCILGWVALAVFWMFSGSVQAAPAGDTVYKAKCAACHGPDGAGATPAGKATKARDFCSDEVKNESDDDWTSIIVKGKNKMPGYDKELTDAEIKEVVAYIRTRCQK